MSACKHNTPDAGVQLHGNTLLDTRHLLWSLVPTDRMVAGVLFCPHCNLDGKWKHAFPSILWVVFAHCGTHL